MTAAGWIACAGGGATPEGEGSAAAAGAGGGAAGGRVGASGGPGSAGAGGMDQPGTGGAQSGGITGSASGGTDAGGNPGQGGQGGQGGNLGSGDPADAAPPNDAGAGDSSAGPMRMSEACGKGVAAPKEGLHEIMVGNMVRKFFFRVPSSYDGKKPWPVIFAFHGAGNKSAAWFDTNTDLRPKTEEKAVLLFPEGALRRPGNLSWVHMSPENVLFVDAMMKWLGDNVCIDLGQVFAAGQSSGGYMAMTLGCQRGNVFRAVATSSGGILDPGACTGSPAAIWMRTGKADSASGHKSVLDTRDFWVKAKGCSAEPPKAVDPAPCVSYSGCQGGVKVIFCDDPGGHGWPGYMTDGIWKLFTSTAL